MATPPLLAPAARATEQRAWWARFRAANPDIPAWMATRDYTVHYEAADDTLTIHIGAPRPALSLTIDDRVYFRVDPTTLELVGIEVVDLQAPAATPALQEYLAELRTAVAAATVAEAVRALVEA